MSSDLKARAGGTHCRDLGSLRPPFFTPTHPSQGLGLPRPPRLQPMYGPHCKRPLRWHPHHRHSTGFETISSTEDGVVTAPARREPLLAPVLSAEPTHLHT